MDNSLYICIGTIIGTMIGSIISFLTTLFINHSKNKREDEIYIRTKREVVYREVIDIVYYIHQEAKLYPTRNESLQFSEEIKKKLDEIHSDLLLYSSETVKNKLLEIVNIINQLKSLGDSKDLEEKCERLSYELIFGEGSMELLNLIRKELGVHENKKKRKHFQTCIQCNLCSWIQSKFSAK